MSDIQHHQSATAHKAWDDKWQTESGRARWLEPESEVVRALEELKAKGAARVLDLGCGVGRHALAMARMGFETWGVDMSGSGLEFARQRAKEQGLAIGFKQGEMTALPLDDASFDYVLAWNVIYHGVREVAEASLKEIHRVLKPGGCFHGTMISKRNQRFRAGEEVAPDVWRMVGETEQDHGHPHLFSSAAQVVELFKGFEVLRLADTLQDKPGSYHWNIMAERL